MRTFVQGYLDAEYDLWMMAHTERSDEHFLQAAEKFEERFFAHGVYSDISRPRNMNDERFQAFHVLLSAKQKRPLYCMVEDDTGVTQAVLGSIDHGSAHRFELIRIRVIDGEPKIVSSYLTNFDGTFSYSGGEEAGEHLPDPCLG
ncbi:hypothetical protein [Deinococcus peraridilitoris]|uniref:Uncharacterized protein n=1 Tax=Deinococcus peraridilitoris (strain DSM 19664 / LMG 22246 / CIP 109416 / KR-200) TaxID=937777 RepID=L0A3J6_DEIPD|nr:hypothetical protein [Deinococcus peraridilitoris]AFZ68009.1 hypothetical protein Deipe_2544 [Deinococcus peraridilitoris DSM 19664]